MPDMDGLVFIRKIRSRGLNKTGEDNYLPAVAITAFAHVDDRVKALSAGFNSHLPKPVNPTELILTIDGLVQKNNHAKH